MAHTDEATERTTRDFAGEVSEFLEPILVLLLHAFRASLVKLVK